MNENVSMTKEEIYSKDYIPYSIKYGRMTSLIGVVASFVPLIVLAACLRCYADGKGNCRSCSHPYQRLPGLLLY